jgi:hypothetical protein
MLKRLLIGLAVAILSATALFAQTNAPTTNIPVVIAAGNSFQTILAAQSGTTTRRSLTIQNNNTNTDSCWLFIGGGSATKATSIVLLPGGSYQRYFPYLPSDAIQATCATTADTMYLDVQ